MSTNRSDVQTLADKLSHRFTTIHPRGRGPYTNAEVEGPPNGGETDQR